MDQDMSEYSRDPIVVTGLGVEVPAAVNQWSAAGAPSACQLVGPLFHDADPIPFLRVKKTAKFMSKQDRLALSAAARAVQSAALTGELLDTQVMIAMCVGFIPFEKNEAVQIAEHSRQKQEFSMEAFSREAYDLVNPTLLFACLPNMPTYHISVNLGIRGGYFLTYPSCAESYLALRNAEDALVGDRAQVVLFGAVSDQQNFLVLNHHQKTGQGLPAPDGACFLVLEKHSHARDRKAPILAQLRSIRLNSESSSTPLDRPFYFGPTDLPLTVARFIEGRETSVMHRIHENGYLFESLWVR